MMTIRHRVLTGADGPPIISRDDLNHAIEMCSRMKWWTEIAGMKWVPGRQEFWRGRHAGLSLMDGLDV